MDDQTLIGLYWARDEGAIKETSAKYGKLCRYIISRIARNLALKKWEYLSAAKRNPSAIISLDELGDCVSGRFSIESEIESKHIESTIDTFLWEQGYEKRNIFIRRYWYFDSIESICEKTGFSQSKVKSILYELRLKLRKYLESEGIEV